MTNWKFSMKKIERSLGKGKSVSIRYKWHTSMTKVQNITADIDNNVKPQSIMVDTTRCNNRLYSRLRWPFAANYQQSYPTLSVASFLANNTLTRACILITSRPNDLYNTHPPGLCVGQVKNWQRKIFFFILLFSFKHYGI